MRGGRRIPGNLLANLAADGDVAKLGTVTVLVVAVRPCLRERCGRKELKHGVEYPACADDPVE